MSLSLLSMGGLSILPPAHATQSSLKPDVSHHFEFTSTDKVFHIGANKAGTTSMWLFYSDLPQDWNPCHDLCKPGDVNWAAFSHKHNAKSQDLINHRVFLDNGDEADFKWLYKAFPSSRFVLNLRKLSDWLVSRYDMIRAIRTAGGCTPNGTATSCDHGYYTECAPQAIFPGKKKCLKSRLTWTGNSAHEMKQWIYGLAVQQSNQYSFFAESEERMNRFVMADFTDDEEEENAIRRLAWINRKDLTVHKTSALLDMYHGIPADVPKLQFLPGPHKIPHMLPDPHSAASKTWIAELLSIWGCSDQADARIYVHCKNEIEQRATDEELLELKSLPKISSPFGNISESWWAEHNYTHMGLPADSVVVEVAEDGAETVVAYGANAAAEAAAGKEVLSKDAAASDPQTTHAAGKAGRSGGRHHDKEDEGHHGSR